jgi:transcriptional regulator with XRE-family HTH domain
MDRTYYGGVERGERNVSIDNIERIARGLGISPHQLLIAREWYLSGETRLAREVSERS